MLNLHHDFAGTRKLKKRSIKIFFFIGIGVKKKYDERLNFILYMYLLGYVKFNHEEGNICQVYLFLFFV